MLLYQNIQRGSSNLIERKLGGKGLVRSPHASSHVSEGLCIEKPYFIESVMGISETFKINILLAESHSSGARWQQRLWLNYSKCQDSVNISESLGWTVITYCKNRKLSCLSNTGSSISRNLSPECSRESGLCIGSLCCCSSLITQHAALLKGRPLF